MFSVYSIFAQTQINKSIVNLYQNVLFGNFSEDI